jgi:predicted negative regulator of RcsB-dependent stress response
MVGLLAFANESSAPVIVFCVLAALVLGSWGWTKYREIQAEKRSADLRNLYASVHSERVKR